MFCWCVSFRVLYVLELICFTSMQLFLPLSFSFCFSPPFLCLPPCLSLLVSLPPCPFLIQSHFPFFFSFQFHDFLYFSPFFFFPFLSSYASFCLSFPLFIPSFSVIQKPPEDIWRSGSSFQKDDLFWMHCISVAVFLPPDALFTVSDASKARENPFNTHQEKIFLGQLRERPGTSGA